MHTGICLLYISREQENKVLYILRHIKKILKKISIVKVLKQFAAFHQTA